MSNTQLQSETNSTGFFLSYYFFRDKDNPRKKQKGDLRKMSLDGRDFKRRK